MERVAFLIERTGEHVSCLLNPESLVLRRQAGVQRRRGATGIITGHGLSDDPVIATGGGITELDLDLMFDVDIAREGDRTAAAVPMSRSERSATAPVAQMDVRELTRPVWNLAENAKAIDDYGVLPTVRLIWGRAWNIYGIVVAVAERLERFTASGVPQRSFMRLRMRRLAEQAAPIRSAKPSVSSLRTSARPGSELKDVATLALTVGPDGKPTTRLDQIAEEKFGDPSLWRWIASFNDVDDPLKLAEGTVLKLPPPPRHAEA